ncbi:hypothetical protein TIFTF001_033342 [Ficus carica]|uniref:Uncharacterized protein n=1 Tax=Ficus carica TaxID=3494 RepID=A0AA88E0C8_FICCA|nr:hypothetical protein TIFTF001_033342 [Ficus carica]
MLGDGGILTVEEEIRNKGGPSSLATSTGGHDGGGVSPTRIARVQIQSWSGKWGCCGMAGDDVSWVADKTHGHDVLLLLGQAPPPPQDFLGPPNQGQPGGRQGVVHAGRGQAFPPPQDFLGPPN